MSNTLKKIYLIIGVLVCVAVLLLSFMDSDIDQAYTIQTFDYTIQHTVSIHTKSNWVINKVIDILQLASDFN